MKKITEWITIVECCRQKFPLISFPHLPNNFPMNLTAFISVWVQPPFHTIKIVFWASLVNFMVLLEPDSMAVKIKCFKNRKKDLNIQTTKLYRKTNFKTFTSLLLQGYFIWTFHGFRDPTHGFRDWIPVRKI